MGLQYPPLAATALNALERLSARSHSTLLELAATIVPLMEPYLAPIDDRDAAPVAAEEPGSAEAGETADEGEAAASNALKKVKAEAEFAAKRARQAQLQVSALIHSSIARQAGSGLISYGRVCSQGEMTCSNQ
jgi:hypothetical protein